MAGLSYAAVPLYRLFCEATGYEGTTRISDGVGVPVIDRKITVRFDANVAPGLDWDFRPLQSSVMMNLGEVTTIFYEAHNRSGKPLTGTATFNVTPEATGAYFNKIECFCFTETVLQAGQSLKMPVVFYVDPALVDSEEAGGVATITLSYTFFRADDPEPLAANKGNPGPAGNGG